MHAQIETNVKKIGQRIRKRRRDRERESDQLTVTADEKNTQPHRNNIE